MRLHDCSAMIIRSAFDHGFEGTGCLQISSQHHFFAFLRDVHSESAPVLYENDSSGIRSIITLALYIPIGFERCGDTGSVSCASSAQPLRFHKCVCFEGGAESEAERCGIIFPFHGAKHGLHCDLTQMTFALGIGQRSDAEICLTKGKRRA